MNENETKQSTAPKEFGKATLRRRKHVAANRASAQRDKLDAKAEERAQQSMEHATPRKGKQDQQRLLAKRRARTTLARAVDDYLQDHAGNAGYSCCWMAGAWPPR
jgi:hypothetical protein